MNRPGFRLRPARAEDTQLLLEWRNDPVTVRNSMTRSEVNEKVHREWMEKILKDSDRKLFILEIEGKPAGQLRLDKIADSTAEISYGLGEDFRGRGYGRLLIEEAEKLAAALGVDRLQAEVLPHNEASCRIFKKQGFQEEKKEDYYVYQKYCR